MMNMIHSTPINRNTPIPPRTLADARSSGSIMTSGDGELWLEVSGIVILISPPFVVVSRFVFCCVDVVVCCVVVSVIVVTVEAYDDGFSLVPVTLKSTEDGAEVELIVDDVIGDIWVVNDVTALRVKSVVDRYVE